MKQISFIIITYNRPADTLSLLRDISRLKGITDFIKEVILLNNASTADYTPIKDFINAQTDITYRFIESPANLGVSGGRNLATSFATGDLFVYLDDDVNIRDPEILSGITNCFSENSPDGRKTGVVSFKVLYSSTGKMQVNAFPHKNFKHYKDLPEFTTYYYAGCAHAITREAWLAAGNYPEDFFYGMEEYDFSYRLISKGYCIKYNDKISLYHKESPLGRKPKPIKLSMMWVNKSKVAWRYLPKKYFYSTSLLWSLFFLVKTGGNLGGFLKGWKKILEIKSTEKRNPLGSSSLDYLRDCKARLWY